MPPAIAFTGFVKPWQGCVFGSEILATIECRPFGDVHDFLSFLRHFGFLAA